MANYTPPPKSNIPFHFDTNGYQAPNFEDISFNSDSIKEVRNGTNIQDLSRLQGPRMAKKGYCKPTSNPQSFILIPVNMRCFNKRRKKRMPSSWGRSKFWVELTA